MHPKSRRYEPVKEPEDLRRRIKAFREGYEPRQGTWARGIGLVFSLGATMIAGLLLGLWLGGLVEKHTGSPWAVPGGLFLGLGLGGYCVYKMLKPFLQD